MYSEKQALLQSSQSESQGRLNVRAAIQAQKGEAICPRSQSRSVAELRVKWTESLSNGLFTGLLKCMCLYDQSWEHTCLSHIPTRYGR